MTQYVVAYLPDDTLHPAAIGPFRTYEKAMEVANAIYDASEGLPFGTVPQAIELGGLAEVLTDLREMTAGGRS